MSDATEVLTVQEGQAAVKQVAVSGEIISLPSATDVKAIVQTDEGPVAAVKTVSLGGGSASGNFVEQLSTMPEASTKQGKIVQFVGTEAGTYNHGAFYESVEQATSNSYSDYWTQRGEMAITDVDVFFDFLNKCIERAGNRTLAVGDSVKYYYAIPDTEQAFTSFYVETTRGGITYHSDIDFEWVMGEYPDANIGIEMLGYSEDSCTFTVTGIAGTEYIWQETTVDKLLEAMVENNASVLHTTTSLATSRNFTKSISLASLTAYSSLDSRPSHKAPGAIVINDNQNQIGIITDVDDRNATVVTVFTGFTGTGVPAGGGAYKVLGSASSSTAAWVEALIIRDISATVTNAGSTYFGGKPFMSKTGANGTTKFQSYTVTTTELESAFTITHDGSEGQIKIVDASILFASINEELSNSGAGVSVEPGYSVMLTLITQDWDSDGVVDHWYVEASVSSPDGMRSGSFNNVGIYDETGLEYEWGLESTLGPGEFKTIQFTADKVGGTFYLYESQGCAKVQAATETDPTYVFSMPGNMVQMGGIVDLPSMGPGVAVENTPVTLPKELANANYVVQLTVITESGFQQIVVDASNRTTTGFDICARNNDTAETVTGAKVAWTVVGVIPMTLFTGQA